MVVFSKPKRGAPAYTDRKCGSHQKDLILPLTGTGFLC